MQPSERRGPWYLLSFLSPILLFLGLRGFVGPDAQDESETAVGDWARLTRSPVVRVAWLVLVAVAIVAVVVIIRSR